jgi:hypothetical protein
MFDNFTTNALIFQISLLIVSTSKNQCFFLKKITLQPRDLQFAVLFRACLGNNCFLLYFIIFLKTYLGCFLEFKFY